jgi:hypothetical protein
MRLLDLVRRQKVAVRVAGAAVAYDECADDSTILLLAASHSE